MASSQAAWYRLNPRCAFLAALRSRLPRRALPFVLVGVVGTFGVVCLEVVASRTRAALPSILKEAIPASDRSKARAALRAGSATRGETMTGTSESSSVSSSSSSESEMTTTSRRIVSSWSRPFSSSPRHLTIISRQTASTVFRACSQVVCFKRVS